ncbi:MAG: MinD/ParA family protein [Spirochaetaceae bacterium]|nr:MAG: MinD/ParA family protein [Spirochaetaceae bacterium]
MQFLPVASGKGGVGKSVLAANLGILLARAGKRVVLADLDFGGSNLHLILGLRGITAGIGTFLSDPDVAFDSIVLPTDYPNLHFIPGDNELPGIANLTSGQKRKLMSRLRRIDADYVILDLAAGTSFNVTDFLLLSNHGLIVTTPTPTALVNAYLCIKNAVFRILTTTIRRGSPADDAYRAITKESDTLQRIYFPDLVARIEAHDPETVKRFHDAASRFRPRIVMNMIDDPKQVDKAHRLRTSCEQYLGLEIEHFGVLYRDSLQDTALDARVPIVRYKPQSVLAQAIARIADRVIERSDDDAMAWIETDESFLTAASDAESDYETRSDYVRELLHTGALSEGDIQETVKSQQIEIGHLRRENNLLKAKLRTAIQQGFTP